MKKHLKYRQGERLFDWVDRLASAYNLTPEQKEMVIEVSKQSYIVGANVANSLKYQ